ncbi:hypothetical protein CTEN210_08887 [Chaetoceros tenuissimus]|uniref:C2H2-type domain-containing protein n=1 Tax=Chaetoceros tenuissimus TaxID=426638 RepID=A0AAD3H6U5_9STRA|nr:hypothetical protein CTEN210_08887 [Chaetoceros tenuissimus]
MPKAEKGTPKDIANRMKAKGLQKLKFYCQMCAKQCRDENGFKCHLTSDSHLRQMKIFCGNASSMLDSFSAEFEKNYLDTLYRRHRTKKMNANNIYQELIQDKHHVHMNSTKWTTLSDFVQYLGKSGKCVVEETERGWYVTYIERDPEILAQQENYQRRVESEKREEEKLAKRMEKQRMEAAKLMDRAGVGLEVRESKIDRSEGDKPIALAIANTQSKKSKKKKKGLVFGGDDDDEDEEIREGTGETNDANVVEDPVVPLQKKERNSTENSTKQVETNESKKKRSENEIDDKPPSKKQKVDYENELEDVRKKNWIRKDILVRIISKKVSKGKYYKRKAIITKVYDKFTAEVEILDSGPDERDGGDILEVDQEHLETVVPKEGKKVKVLNGVGRGELAILLSADHDKCRGKLELVEDGTILRKVDFDDFSKAV